MSDAMSQMAKDNREWEEDVRSWERALANAPRLAMEYNTILNGMKELKRKYDIEYNKLNDKLESVEKLIIEADK